MLDAGPLGRLAHSKPKPDILAWVDAAIQSHVELILPEIADFEVRRSLLLHQLTASIAILDQLKQDLVFQPITSAVMLKAAQFWAQARKQGQPTADAKELDCDVVLAAQAADAGAIIATDNVGHLSRFVTAVDWRKMAFLP